LWDIETTTTEGVERKEDPPKWGVFHPSERIFVMKNGSFPSTSRNGGGG